MEQIIAVTVPVRIRIRPAPKRMVPVRNEKGHVVARVKPALAAALRRRLAPQPAVVSVEAKRPPRRTNRVFRVPSASS